jgi:hypothetical protein
VIGAYSTGEEEMREEEEEGEGPGDGSGGRILVYCDSYLIDMKPTHQPPHGSGNGDGVVDSERILLESFLDYLIHGVIPSKIFSMQHLQSQSFEENRLMFSASSRQRVDEDLLRQERKMRSRDFLR